MKYTVAPSDDGKYVIVEVAGDVTREGAASFVAAAWKKGEELGVHCILIDVTQARNVQSKRENVHFAMQDARTLPPPRVKACSAVLVDPDDHSHDFFVAFAQSQRIDISLFWSRAEAIGHLARAATYVNPTKSSL